MDLVCNAGRLHTGKLCKPNIDYGPDKNFLEKIFYNM